MSQDDKKKRKFSELSPAANVLQSLLKSSKSPLSDQFQRWRLWQDWEKVMGAEIAKHSMPVGLLNGTLYVWVNSAARMQEMIFMVRAVLRKVNDYAGKHWITSIRFTLDQKLVQAPEQSDEAVHKFIAAKDHDDSDL